MLTKFAEDSIIDIWQNFECTPECNSMESQKKVAPEVILKMEIFKAWNTAGINPFAPNELFFYQSALEANGFRNQN